MKFKKSLILLPVLIAAAGCASSVPQDYGDETAAEFNEAVSEWIGHNQDELLLAWGIPSKEAELSDGKKLLQYEEATDVPLGDDKYQRQACEVSVMLGADGLVTAARGKGNGCLVDKTMMENFPKP